MSGPPPKRDEERRRRNKAPEGLETMKVDLDAVLAGEVEIPAPPMRPDEHKETCADDCTKHTGELVPAWHQIAYDLYMSLTRSGQALFYEPSDWMFAYTMCEIVSRELMPKPVVIQTGDGESEVRWVKSPVNGAAMGQAVKMAADLMVAEGGRRRLRIELDRKKAQDAKIAGDGKVVSIVKKREDLFT